MARISADRTRRLPNAIDILSRQLSIYDRAYSDEPDDFRTIDAIAIAHRRMAESHLALGDIESAKSSAAKAAARLERLLARDDGNAYWKISGANLGILRSQIAEIEGRMEEAAEAAERAVALIRSAAERDRSDTRATQSLALSLAQRVRVEGNGEVRLAAANALRTLYDANLDEKRDPEIIGFGGGALAQYYLDTQARGRADAIARSALHELDQQQDKLSARLRLPQLQLCRQLNGATACREYMEFLDGHNFKHPEYIKLRNTALADTGAAQEN